MYAPTCAFQSLFSGHTLAVPSNYIKKDYFRVFVVSVCNCPFFGRRWLVDVVRRTHI